jgi:hypothetical protein
METKKSKTGAIVGTVVTALVCGCLSLCLCIIGAGTAFGGGTFETTWGDVTNMSPLDPSIGYALLCAAIFAILIPVVVGFVTLRNRKPKVVDTNETLPPTA